MYDKSFKTDMSAFMWDAINSYFSVDPKVMKNSSNVAY